MGQRRVVLAGSHAKPYARRRHGSTAQRGFGGFLLIALIAGMAGAAGLFTFYRTDAVRAQSERATTDVLAIAKAALIGYAVGRGGSTGLARPGELPCPDTDGDGFENAPCETTASLMGRIPWKTLGIPEPKDGSETLWYALSTAFRSWPSASTARRINSDTRGNITVRGPDGSVLTDAAAAVIFAPGPAIGAQNRSGGALAVSYMDSAVINGVSTNNAASASGPFIAGARTDTFNDRLIYLTAPEIMPALEMRVGAELKALLQAYRANSVCKCYPWADNWPYSGGIADVGQNRGRFPSVPYPEQWGDAPIPALPAWVAANDWHNFFWYSVGRQNSNDRNQTCRTCSVYSMLKVTDTSKGTDMWVSALLFTPGPPLDGIARMNTSSRRDNLSLYLQDSSNNDGASNACPDVGEIGGTEGSGMRTGALSCDTYVVPTSRSMNRDRLFMVGVSSPGTCAAHASTLLSNATCSIGGGAVKAVCQTAVNNLDACPCLDGAREMIATPCRNETNSPQCQVAMAQLKACN